MFHVIRPSIVKSEIREGACGVAAIEGEKGDA